MKNPFSIFVVGSLFVLAAPLLPAVEVASDPVGFVKVDGQAATDLSFSSPLHQPPVFAGIISELVDGSTIRVSSAPGWAANAWAGSVKYYLQVSSGEREGLFAQITANGTDTLTLSYVSENLGTVAGDRVQVGDKVQVIPFWTLGTLLPTGTVPAGAKVFLYDRANPGTNAGAIVVTYVTGKGWLSGPENNDGEIIYPDESVVVRLPSASPSSLVVTGMVPREGFRSFFSKSSAAQVQEVRLTTRTPVPVNLRDIFAAPVEGDQVLLTDNTVAGINKAPVVATFATGAWKVGAVPYDTYSLKPGEGFVYRLPAPATGARTMRFKPSYQP